MLGMGNTYLTPRDVNKNCSESSEIAEIGILEIM